MRWPWQRPPRPVPAGHDAREALYRAQKRLDEVKREVGRAEHLAEQVRWALGVRP